MSGEPVIAPCPFGCPTEVDEDQRSPHLVMRYVGPSPLTQHAGPYTKSHRVVCAVCRCRGPEFVEHNWTREMADAEAVRLWNSRILDEEARKLEILQKINAKVGGPEPCEYDPDCPSCGGHGWRDVDVRNPDGSRGVDQELCDCAALRSTAPGAEAMRDEFTEMFCTLCGRETPHKPIPVMPETSTATSIPETEIPARPYCELCGELMPPGEEMFKYHGASGPCPTRALPVPAPEALASKAKDRFDNFGRLIWLSLKKHYADAEMTEGDEEYIKLALLCGLCTREPYDREKHGFVNDAEPGDMIYVW